MPNWCENNFTASGDPAELRRFAESSMGFYAQYPLTDWDRKAGRTETVPTEKYFCFNALVRTPPEVLQNGYDSHAYSPEILARIKAGEKTGVMDGYHWSIDNWGTKWDIYYDEIGLDDMNWSPDGSEISFSFDTAWSPPVPWFYRITELFPTLSFTLEYAESGCWFGGRVTYEDGQLEEHEFTEKELKEYFDWLDEEAPE